MFGIKQEALAIELGDDWNQKRISLLEAKETIDDKLLEQVAKVLKVPSEAIKNFDDETAINVISNTFGDHAVVGNNNPVINTDVKLAEALAENKQLYQALLRER